MQRIRFMAEEFFRSFQKSLFKNILLMLMFSISLLMAIIMCSYYVGLGERYETTTQKVDGREWYPLDLMTESGQEVSNQFTTVGRCRDMVDYYETLKSLEEAPILSIHTSQSVGLKEEDVKKFFGEKDVLPFTSGGEVNVAEVPFWDGDTYLTRSMKGAQVDLGAYRYFGLVTQEGEGFTEENMTIERDGDPIPLLLGSDYKGIIEVGTIIGVNFETCAYHCKVVGILEKGSKLPVQGHMELGEFQYLDNRIIFPYGIKLLEDPERAQQMERYAWNAFMALQNGIAQTKVEHIRELVETYGQIADQFGYPPVQIIGTSLGLDLLRRESAARVRVLLILTVVLLCFSFYGLSVTFYDKIQSNSKNYGIYLMNGCSLSMILVPCLLEIAVILFPAVVIGRYVFPAAAVYYFRAGPIMQAVYIMIGAAFLVGATFLAYLMRGVDTEHLIRQRD